MDEEIDDDPGPIKHPGSNGERYTVTCPEVSSRWPHHGVEFELILPSLSVLGKFDFGIVSGTIFFQDANMIEWRGIEEDGTVHCFSDCNSYLPGWIRFLHGGRRIEGYLGGTMNLAFTGVRDPGHKAVKGVYEEAIERTHEAFSLAPSVKIGLARRDGRWPDSDDFNSDSEVPEPSVVLTPVTGHYVLTPSCVGHEYARHIGKTVPCLDIVQRGQQLWGRLDLGAISVIINLPRPVTYSRGKTKFAWRGRKENGVEYDFTDDEVGWIRFLRGGRLEGRLLGLGIGFRGQRQHDQGTAEVIKARKLKKQWWEYGEDAFD
ncbi:hypothetical protein GE09DRAFT_47284 [Coniochaeta sp. 2T2.1]|nr:hypothetical protein GE09DRAFT_47284 [Coniochaeta sp. 2T2.1]